VEKRKFVEIHRGDNYGKLLYGIDARKALSRFGRTRANCIVSSPPYWLHRKYGGEPQKWEDDWVGELGLETQPDQYARHMAEVFRSARKVLRTDGVLWLVLGDTYMSNETNDPTRMRTGIQGKRIEKDKSYADAAAIHIRPAPKDVGLRFKALTGVPWRVAFALQKDGWILRNEMIWHRPDHMPSRARDRLLTGHETVFLFSRSRHYWFDREGAMAAGLPTERRRDVWTFPRGRSRGRHHAVMPTSIIEPMIRMGCPEGGVVLDPFAGTSAVGEMALKLGRNYIGIDLNETYLLETEERFSGSDFQPSESYRRTLDKLKSESIRRK